MNRAFASLAVFVVVSVLPARNASAVAIGLTDTFEDGTTLGWQVALLGMTHPAPPINVGTGGPAGTDDAFLQLTAIGGAAAGSRLSVINAAQWAGNYLTSGVNAIAMDVNNFGSTSLALRMVFEDPTMGPPTNIAISSEAIIVPAGSGWTSIMFPVSLLDLTAVLGSTDLVLGNTTVVRLVHSTTAGLPPDPIVASLGVDNIEAVGVPEPSLALLSLVGAAAMIRRRRR